MKIQYAADILVVYHSYTTLPVLSRAHLQHADQETPEMADQLNKADQAYQALEAMIVFQELPPGSLISERLLMERTGFGRTPVREALQRLARDRMVDIHPSRGVLVADMSIESYLRLLEVRRSLEDLAARLAAHRAEPHQRDAMRTLADTLARFHGDDIGSFGPLLRHSHTLVAQAAHNEYLQVAITPMQGLSRRFWFANLRNVAEDLRAGADRHCALLQAIRHADADQAAQASLRLNDYLVEFAYRTLHDKVGTTSRAPSPPPT
jgi:DNA-binding GntR family transcriptional regulator